MKNEYPSNASICDECNKIKIELKDMQNLCNQLQFKYDNLERQKSITSSNSVRFVSNSNNDYSRLKEEF